MIDMDPPDVYAHATRLEQGNDISQDFAKGDTSIEIE
jgi:hypothetical protein